MPEQIQGTAVCTADSGIKTSKSAIWSLICGIAGIILCLPAIPAIILGIIGLVNIKKSAGALKGKGMAIAGLILGGLWIIVLPVMIIALPVIAMVGAIAIPGFMTTRSHAMESKAKVEITNIESALELYRMDFGSYPSNEQGLQVLINNEQRNPYLTTIPNDPWSRPYQYRYPSEHNQDSFDLWSAGADGQDGTKDDVTNWQK